MYNFYFCSARWVMVLVIFLQVTLLKAANQQTTQSTNNFTANHFTAGYEPDVMLNNGDTKHILDSLLLLQERQSGDFPPIWNQPINTGTPHGFIIMLQSNPRLNDIPLKPGDWIGGFYLDHEGNRRCGGARMWTDTANMMLTLFGNDGMTNPIKDGFYGGEVVEFRFFMWETQKEYFVTSMSYHVELGWASNGKWYPTSLSKVLDMKAITNIDFYISSSNNPICINNEVTLSAEEFIGTNGTYTFDWFSEPPGFDYNLQNPPPVVLNTNTLFSLVVSDGIDTSYHQIELVVHDHPAAFAGNDAEFCSNQTFQLSGEAEHASEILWTTNGDGAFSNPTIINPVYTPGNQAKINGFATITLTANPLNPCSVVADDELALTILPIPLIDAGEDKSACGNEPLWIEATAEHYGTLQWATSGSGTFSDPGSPVSQYIPSTSDIENGVTLTLCAEAINPCVAMVCDYLSVAYLAGPFAATSSTIRICENEIVTLSGSVSNNSGLLWTTNGDGSFSNPSVIPTTYIPGPQDIENSGTIITLHALPIAPCDIPESKNLSLEIQKLPNIITFGPNTDFACLSKNYIQLNGVAENYSGTSWSRIGDGFFTSTTNLTSRYYYGANDKANGHFTITLNAGPKMFCSTGAAESKTIYIVENPEVQIAQPVSNIVCETDAFALEATASFSDLVEWTTSGDGYFDDVSLLNPVYFPGPTDLLSSVELKITASPVSPCTVSAETGKLISFESLPTAEAGEDATILSIETHSTTTASAQNYAGAEWTTTGDGYFDDPNALVTNYLPGSNDMISEEVKLILTALPNQPCQTSTSDTLTLIILLDGCYDATAFAGGDQIICSNENLFITTSQAGFYTSLQWSTSGDGIFDDPSKLKPVYFPGPNDIIIGEVNLCLTAFAFEDCEDATNCMTLTINEQAFANAGEDATICQGTGHQLTGTAQNHISLIWESSGDGTFSDPFSLNPHYTHGPNDLTNGSVNLCLSASASAGCPDVSSCITLFIQKSPVVNAGVDFTVCENQLITLSGEVNHSNSFLWESNGDGSFNNTSLLNPVYTPGAGDIAIGLITFCLTANGENGCPSVEDCISVTLQQLPMVFAGDDITACENDMVDLSGFAANHESVAWSTSGDGTFTNPSNLNTGYTPGSSDIVNGFAIVCLTANGLSTCDDAEDCLTIYINKAPHVNAGSNISVCGDDPLALNASAQNYNSINWATSGDGSFNNTTALSPVYTPGPLDVQTGQVQLCATATGNDPCNSTSDCLTLFINQTPEVNAGNNITICEDDVLPIAAVAQHHSYLQWTSSGDGTFECDECLNTAYTPGAGDIALTTVELCLTAFGKGVCGDATDCFVITIRHNPIVNAGPDAVIEFDEHFTFQDVTAENASALFWTSNGTGNFSSAAIVNPTYYPSQQDYDAGSVVLTLTALPLNPCNLEESDTMSLSFVLGCENAISNAGADFTACAVGGVPLAGAAQNQTGVLWNTAGDGYFENETSLITTYYPGNIDLAEGSVNLCLTSFGLGECADDTDCVMVTLTPPPSANAGQDITICETQIVVPLSGSVQNASSMLWTTSGDGFFVGQTTTAPYYYPGTADIINGEVTITLTAHSIHCPAVSDHLLISIELSPFAFAGDDATICAGEAFTTSEAFSFNYLTIAWSTSGDGSFANPGNLVTTYNPGPLDMQTGLVELCINASTNGPCQNDSDCITLTILPSASVNAGQDIAICETAVAELNAQALNYENVLWETFGDGIFQNSGSLITTYTPGQNDISSGSVQLSITAFSNTGCGNDIDHLTVNIEKTPLAFAGFDQTICETTVVNLAGSAQHFSTLQWSSQGDGTFSDNSIIDPVYFPGTNDIASGQVMLFLTAHGLQFCGDATDEIVIFIQKAPAASAGEDITICETVTEFSLNGQASDYASVLWTSNGDGYFSNAASPGSFYIPGLTDLSNGFVELCFAATGLNDCEPVEDCLTITFQQSPTAFAGDDATICESQNFTLSAFAQNHSGITWQTSGDGYFADPGSLITTYVPGTNDKAAGVAQLCITADGLEGCEPVSDCLSLAILPEVILDAGNDFYVCETDAIGLSATAQNHAGILWSTTGDGYFTQPGSLITQYVPGVQDLQGTNVELCITAEGVGPCNEISDCVTITFVHEPIVFAGSNATISKNQTFIPMDAFIENSPAFHWSTSGTGTFDNSELLHPEYTPGHEDIIAESVVLTLTAGPENPCQISATDELTLTITYNCLDAVADAGGDVAVCYGDDIHLINATASYYGSVSWSTSGDGVFDNPTALNPVYSPGTNDLAGGAATLCITAFAQDDCMDAQDCITLTIQQLPDVYAGEDKTIPFESSYYFGDAWAENYSVLQWFTTNGMGAFTDETIINTTYNPSPFDLLQEFIEIKVTCFSLDPCTVYVEDNVLLTFYDGCLDAIADAGADFTACAVGGVTLAGAAQNQTGVLWNTAGDGYFENETSLITTYYPGNNDLAEGSVNLCLTSFGLGECEDDTDCVMVTLSPPPSANAGQDITICETQIVVSLSGSVQNASSILWTTSGDGFFVGQTTTAPYYYPGSGDIVIGEVIITLTAFSDYCPAESDHLLISIEHSPFAFAGDDATICAGEAFTTSDAFGFDYETIAWSTSGDGSFANPGNLVTTYNPGPLDMQTGLVELCINATANGPCQNASDCITLTILPQASVIAGVDVSICETAVAELNAQAFNYENVLWETFGDGVFQNSGSLITTYTPGQNDISSGSVQLSITAFSNTGCGNDIDHLTVNIEKTPVAFAGEDQTICENGQVSLQGDAQNHSSVLWATQGDGTFTSDQELTTTYIPGSGDLQNGYVSLCLTAGSAGLCPDNSDCLTVHISPLPTANAGGDATICATDDYLLNGSATSYSSLLWVTDGNGTFNQNGIENPTYSPGVEDINAGFAELCLIAEPIDPCLTNATDCMTLHFAPLPHVNITEDNTVCENNSFTFNPDITGGCGLLWQSSGDGFFDNHMIINPTYTPGPLDIENGFAEICLTVQACAPCNESVVVCINLTIQKQPDVAAGNDATICAGEPYLLSEATAGNYSSLVWVTEGDGVFDDSTSINPSYTPGSADLNAGSVTICLYAQPADPCTIEAQDCLTLSILPPVTANAGDDMTVCETSSYVTLNGGATNHNSVYWTSSGTGQFNNPTGLTTRYFFSYLDKLTGQVYLTLHAVNPDCGTQTDTIEIMIVPSPVVFAGLDATICFDESFELSDAVALNAENVAWATSGDGYFSSPDLVQTTYYPGAADILNGTVDLCLSAIAATPCIDKTDCITLTILPSAIVFAGDDISICESEAVELNATAEDFESVLWQTSGDGTFENPFSLNTTYQPGVQDIAGGMVNLTIIAVSSNGCSQATDELQINIEHNPEVSAGTDATICQDDQLLLEGFAENHSTVLWTTDGDGAFGDENAQTTVYLPGAVDIQNGFVTVCLTAWSNGSCPEVTDCISLSINQSAVADAGSDATICETDSYMVIGNAANHNGTLWFTDGDGTFDNPESLVTSYTPGQLDIAQGEVVLTLLAYGHENCPNTADAMILKLNPPPFAYAGQDGTICENENYVLSGMVDHSNTFYWQTSGDGTFGDIYNLNTIYTPGPDDIATGSVEICLTADPLEGCASHTGCMVLTIQPLPVVDLGGDEFHFCVTDQVLLEASALHYTSVSWTTGGDGYFTAPGNLTTVYIPGEQDLATGSAELCLSVTGAGSCGEVNDCLTVNFISLPEVFAGEDATITKNNAFVAMDATVADASAVEWTTSGTGSFDDNTLLHAAYMPSSGDMINQPIILTLTAYPDNPCLIAASDELLLTIDYNCLDATANAGGDGAVCLDSDYYLANAAVSSDSALVWSTSGDGVFDDLHRLDATYTPGENDLLNGQVTLCITAFAFDDCEDAANCMTLTIIKPPAAFAGHDNTAPAIDYSLNSAWAENHAGVQWLTTNGMGVFQNENEVNTVYSPSMLDQFLVYIELILLAQPIDPCNVVAEAGTQVKFVEYCQDATVTVDQQEIYYCEDNASVQPVASGSFWTGISWSTSGDGYFEYGNTFIPVYLLGPNDLLTDEITLTVTVTGFEGCQNATDNMTVKKQLLPLAEAGNDQTICAEDVFITDEAVVENATAVTWSTSGDGIFTNPDQLLTQYSPGQNDITDGMVVLTITVESGAPCNQIASASMNLYINSLVLISDIEDQDVMVGEPALFSVEANQAENYQWFGPEGLIPDAVSPTLEITNVEYADAGIYYCEIFGSCTTIFSNSANLVVYELQQLLIPEGWSGISSWIVPFNSDIELLFNDVLDDLVLIKNFEGIYCPMLNLSVLMNWSEQKGYETKFDNGVVVEFKGKANTNLSFTINPGWNYLPVISRCPVNIDVLFGTPSSIQIMKEIGGSGVYWPALGVNSIGQLQPGKAYLVRSQASFTITFPICDNNKSAMVNDAWRPANHTSWNDIHYTGSSHVVAFDEKLTSVLGIGNIIGAFTQTGLCAGMATINAEGAVLTMFGNDPLSFVTDGFAEQEMITFKLYDAGNGNVFNLEVAYDQQFTDNEGAFKTNGLSRIVAATTGATAVNDFSAAPIAVFPNPTSSNVMISGINEQATIEIYSTDGQLLQKLNVNHAETGSEITTVPMANYPAGIYYMRIIRENSTDVRKVIRR